MAKSPTPTLNCSQCGYENEPERVYCHNCGTKLDRSLLPKETLTRQESLQKTRRRIKKLTSPGVFWPTIKTAFSTVFWSALVAVLYLFFSPPANLPTREQESGANIISGPMEDAVASPLASSVQMTTADVSQHVRTRIKKAEVIPGLAFKRTFATLEPDKVTLGIEQDLFGLWPIYSRVEYRAVNENGQVKTEKIGQHFGRLGIDPRIPGLDVTFAKAWAGLKTEQKLLARAQSIKIEKDRAVIITKPGATP
jgi:hypothetical protein